MSAAQTQWAAAFEALLEQDPAVKSNAETRRAAFDRFEAHGLPTRRHEYWKYTPVRGVEPNMALKARGADAFAQIEGYRLVFVDGALDAARSDIAALEQVAEVSTAAEKPAWVDQLYKDVQRAHTHVERPFAELNMALCTSVAVRFAAGAKAPKPIILRYEGQTPAHLRVDLLLQEGAEATVLETGPGALTSLIQASIEQGARLDHLRVQTESSDQQFAHLFARVAQKASLASFTLSADAALLRNETIIDLAGDDAVGHVAGAVLGRENALTDNTVFVTHGALAGESRQVFKHVLDDAAKGVFQGKILVKQPAQKTDGYQISQSVLLKETAEFDAKPELEIYADDVKCSHGSTTGALDEEQLFYLRSRGASRQAAEAMLIAAFVEEAIEEIADEGLQDVMRAQVALWMEARRTE